MHSKDFWKKSKSIYEINNTPFSWVESVGCWPITEFLVDDHLPFDWSATRKYAYDENLTTDAIDIVASVG